MSDTKEDGVGVQPAVQSASGSQVDNAPVTTNPFKASYTASKSLHPFLRPSQLKAPFLSSNPFSRSNEKTKPDRPLMTSSIFGNSSRKPDVPKFVPLQASKEPVTFAGSNVSSGPPTGLERAGGFVFGQNLQDRVTRTPDEDGQIPSGSNTQHHAANGSTDLLFSSAMQAVDSHNAKPKEEGSSLAASASSWERSSSSWGVPPAPPTQPAGPLLTGEEGETNVVQVNCRLFAFEGGIWRERGRGQLRLNDGTEGSHLVCRAAGSLRVLLNTKVWADMAVERAASKSLRVTATDSLQQLKVFLIMASPEEINLLHKSLTHRVLLSKKSDDSCNSREEEKQAGTSSPQAEEGSPPYPAAVQSNSPIPAGESHTSQAENTENQDDTESEEARKQRARENDGEVGRAALKRPLETAQEDVEAKKPCTGDSEEVAPL